MLVKDAAKTKSKIFIYDMEPSSGFISNGTLWPLGFDLDEPSIFKSIDLQTHIEELEPEWQQLFQPGPAIKRKLIKFMFEEQYIYYMSGTKEITVN